MKLSRREKFLLGALAALTVFAPALNLLADTTPQSQVMYGPGQPVTLTGAGPAGSNTSEVIVETVATKTTGKLLDIHNGGTSKAYFDYTGLLTGPGMASTGATTFTVAAPASVATTGTAASAALTATGQAGGPSAAGATNNTGGAGSPDSILSGAGGAATGAATGTNTGGNGGTYTFGTGNGGAASGATTASVAGNGGAATYSGGAGGVASGTATTNTGGTGGASTLLGGAGGASSGGTTNNGGPGGAANLTAGNGGNGTQTGGAGGTVTITSGSAGTGGNANAGSIALVLGAISGSGTPGAFTVTNAAATTADAATITANAITTGAALDIPHTTSLVANGGSLLKVSSTSADTGTTTGNLADFSASASVAGTLVRIAASNVSQTTEQALAVTQSGTTANYTGKFVDFTCSSTTGTGSCAAIDSVNTTAGNALLVNANSATTTNATAAKISTTALTSGTSVSIVGSGNSTMTSAGKFLRVNDGNADVFAIGYNGHIQVLPTNGTATTVTNTGGSAITCVSGNNTGTCSDTRGQARVTTAANTNAIIITFGVAYLAAPVCVVTPATLLTFQDFNSATIGPAITTSTTAITITPGANWTANAKQINYICME